MDLSIYLERADTAEHEALRSFFGCLVTGLQFLHGRKIRHKDIKPHNILVHQGKVLFTDFGLAFDFTEANESTTVSMVDARTPRYCTPEVAMMEARNTSSDIWSLGIVFLEMIGVLKNWKVKEIYNFFKERGSHREFVRNNLATLPELFGELRKTGELSDNRALLWIGQMLQKEQIRRPTAADLLSFITTIGREQDGSIAFCGSCCSSFDCEEEDLLLK
jgi:serine/threonine protein kinase